MLEELDIINEEKINRYGFERMNQLEAQINQQETKCVCLENIKEESFPGFFTTSAFLIMLDGSLRRPFFIRDEARNRIKKEKLMGLGVNRYT